MTVMEYLRNNTSYFNPDYSIELKDVIDDRGVYCNGYYDVLIKELSKDGLNHVKNARFIDAKIENDCYTIFYIKNIQEYSEFDLEQLLDKLNIK